VRQKIDFKIDQILINGTSPNVFKLAWLKSNHGSYESDTLSITGNFIWLGLESKWLDYFIMRSCLIQKYHNLSVELDL
jgi:hypothetical protein